MVSNKKDFFLCLFYCKIKQILVSDTSACILPQTASCLICINDLKYSISRSEAYLFTARNVDLKRKVKFKLRKCHKTQISDRTVFINRT